MIKKHEIHPDCPTIRVPMALCPAYGDDEFDVRTSKHLADGSRAQYCDCRGCGERFRVLHLPPSTASEGRNG